MQPERRMDAQARPMRGIVASISSDIGAALAQRWLGRGWQVAGTYRQDSPQVQQLRERAARVVACDLAAAGAGRQAADQLATTHTPWDVLALFAGSMEPIGRFADTRFDDWARSIQVNFTGQLEMLHALLPHRSRDTPRGPCVILMAGGGTNSAPLDYSAYTVSKIALIKMCELLDAELPDVRIAIVGPGWVRTKIHRETLAAGRHAGESYGRTLARLASDDFTSMDSVLDCCDWIIQSDKVTVGGRNFSVAFDPWGESELDCALAADSNLFKLRRAGNAQFVAASRRAITT